MGVDRFRVVAGAEDSRRWPAEAERWGMARRVMRTGSEVAMVQTWGASNRLSA